MKILYFFILCFFSNLCFGRSVELDISVVGLEKDVDDCNLKIDFDINKLKDLKDDQVTDEKITFIQANIFTYNGGKDFYESLSDKNSLNRKFIIFLLSEVNKQEVKDFFNKKSLSFEHFYICGLSLSNDKNNHCWNLEDFTKISVDVAFSYYDYDIKNYYFISDYEIYFNIEKLVELNKSIVKYFKNLIKSKNKYFYIPNEGDVTLKNLCNIGIQCGNDLKIDNETKTIKFTIYPHSEKEGLIKPIICRTIDNKEYKIDVNDGFYKISDLYKKIYEKKLIDNMECFSIYKNDGGVFKNEDMLDPEVYLKLRSVYFSYNYSNDVKKEEYIDSKNPKYLAINEIQFYIERLEGYFKRHKDIQLKFKVNNKSYDIDADNPLTNNHYINELVEEIINSSNPNVYVDVLKKKGKEIKNNKPIKTTTTTKIDKIDNSINIVPTKHKKYNTTTESSKTATHTLDSSHIMDKGGISNKPKISGGNGGCRCSCRS